MCIYSNAIIFTVFIGVASNGIFDLSDVKNKILQWKTQKLQTICPSNANNLLNLLNLVCSTAQPSNVTARDACFQCFARVTAMPEMMTGIDFQNIANMAVRFFKCLIDFIQNRGLIIWQCDLMGPQELSALSACATTYFANTSYAGCATSLSALATSALNVQQTGCYVGYCDFVRCLRRTNSVNLITQCTREARTGVNITLDADNVRFFTNVTSCILAKARCGSYNPITGAPQTPGYTTTGSRLSNSLQFSESGELRILAFPAGTTVSASFCTTSANLTQNSWLTNIC